MFKFEIARDDYHLKVELQQQGRELQPQRKTCVAENCKNMVDIINLAPDEEKADDASDAGERNETLKAENSRLKQLVPELVSHVGVEPIEKETENCASGAPVKQDQVEERDAALEKIQQTLATLVESMKQKDLEILHLKHALECNMEQENQECEDSDTD